MISSFPSGPSQVRQHRRRATKGTGRRRDGPRWGSHPPRTWDKRRCRERGAAVSSAAQEGVFPQHRPLRSLRHQAHGGSSWAEGPSGGHGLCAAVGGTEDQPATGSEHAHPPRLRPDLDPGSSRHQLSGDEPARTRRTQRISTPLVPPGLTNSAWVPETDNTRHASGPRALQDRSPRGHAS